MRRIDTNMFGLWARVTGAHPNDGLHNQALGHVAGHERGGVMSRIAHAHRQVQRYLPLSDTGVFDIETRGSGLQARSSQNPAGFREGA